jgi:N-acetylated-alpha-linked acidic dipeptidase
MLARILRARFAWKMKFIRPVGAWIALTALLNGAVVAGTGAMLGFSAENAGHEREWEKTFDAAVNPADQMAWLETMSSEPNQVGSPHDKANAEFTLEKFKEWGWDARIETFYVLYPTPVKIAVELVGPVRFAARLAEPPVAGDRTSDRQAGGLPPYNAYSADGDVTAELVYANFGMPGDYLELERRGISVKGRIVITRYGGGWRGLKPKLAYEHGAVGCIIYSDPHEDGYGVGDVYPKGGNRPADGVQRGSVADMTLYPGDPLTPGVGSTKDAVRLPLSEAKTLMKIPVLPISYGDARPLLEALEGPVGPPSWRGALPITYHMGPGPATVRIEVASEWTQKPIYDVIAVMTGSEYPDQWIVRGNHHDGWVFGAFDPLAGNVALMDEAKAIGALARQGWRPKRTLVYCSWDGEEPGLLGSTEWAETHADELQKKAALYVNSDTNSRGFLGIMEGSHSYQRLVNEVAAEVRDPETGASVLERLRAHSQVDSLDTDANEEQKTLAKAAAEGGDLPLEALGSGSDYSTFVQHLGIASLNLGYSGEGQNAGIYHSAYDSFDHFIHFGDPGLVYGAALSRTAGRIVLRAADADVLPMRFGDLADAVEKYVEQVRKLSENERKKADNLNRLLDLDAFRLAADPTEVEVSPPRKDKVPEFDFGPLRDALARLKKSAKRYDDAAARAAQAGYSLEAPKLARLNGILQGVEQSLLDARGLPGRGWYRHMLYAPGMLTGYGAKTLPGVREAIEQGRWTDAKAYIGISSAAIDACAGRLDEAAGLF